MARSNPNKRQRRWLLETLGGRGWVNPPMFAVLAGYPIRWACSCLRRLDRQDLVRQRNVEGLVLYRLSERARLAWHSRDSRAGQPLDAAMSGRPRVGG